MIYDVVVVGGGTAGCAAAYTAGKLGLKTLIIEKNIHLGGTITSGLVIPVMKSGNNQINTDFKNALIEECHRLGGQTTYMNNPAWFNPEITKIALDNLMKRANVEIFFDTNILGIKIKKNKIKRIKITKEILSAYNDEIEIPQKELSVSVGARYVIDATGNIDVAGDLNIIASSDNINAETTMSLGNIAALNLSVTEQGAFVNSKFKASIDNSGLTINNGGKTTVLSGVKTSDNSKASVMNAKVLSQKASATIADVSVASLNAL